MDVVNRENVLRSHHASLEEQLKPFYDAPVPCSTQFMDMFSTYRDIETQFCLRTCAYADLVNSLIRDIVGVGLDYVDTKLPDWLPRDATVMSLIVIFSQKIQQSRIERAKLVDWFALWDTCPRKKEAALLEGFQKYVVSLHANSKLIVGNRTFTEKEFIEKSQATSDYSIKSLSAKALLGYGKADALNDYCIHANRGLRVEQKRAESSIEFMETAAESFELLARRLMVCFYLKQLIARALHSCPVNVI